MKRWVVAFACAFAILGLPCMAAELTVSAAGGKSITTWHGQADVQAVNVEWSVQRSARTEVGLVLTPMSLWQARSWFGNQYRDGNERVRAVAGSVIYRRSWFVDSRRMHPYVEFAVGPMWAEKQVPASTSRFNIVTQPGAGVVLAPQSRTPVVIGYRLLHISNGGYAPRNPGLNVSAVVIGIRARM